MPKSATAKERGCQRARLPSGATAKCGSCAVWILRIQVLRIQVLRIQVLRTQVLRTQVPRIQVLRSSVPALSDPARSYLIRWKILPQRISVMNGNGRSESPWFHE